MRSDLPKKLSCSRKLMRLLTADLRCRDGHNHLGNFIFHHSSKKALHDDEVGVRIGEFPSGGIQRRAALGNTETTDHSFGVGMATTSVYGALAGSKRQRRFLLECSGSILLTIRVYVSCLARSARGRLGMTSGGSTLTKIEAEDRPADPKGREGYKASCPQGQNHRKKDRIEEVSHLPNLKDNLKDNLFEQRILSKTNKELS